MYDFAEKRSKNQVFANHRTTYSMFLAFIVLDTVVTF